MRNTSGIFRSRADAERAAQRLGSTGLRRDRITLLVPGEVGRQLQCVPLSASEQPGVARALGAVTGAAIGLAVGFGLGVVASAALPGMGPVTVTGFWGATILGLVGAVVGAAAGSALDNALTEGLPEDELFVYQDAVRKHHSVVLAFSDDALTAKSVRRVLAAEGAESIDEARKEWWIGLRSAELEHYSERRVVARESQGKEELSR